MSSWRTNTEMLLGASWYLVVVVLLPVLTLLFAGMAWLWQNDYLLYAVGGWFGVTAIAYALFFGRQQWLRRRGKQLPAGEAADASALPDRLRERSAWSSVDSANWERCSSAIDLWIEEGLPWDELQPRGLELIADISSAYHHAGEEATLRFTLPEGLLILEETARRYRELIDTHLPYADRLTLATLRSVYRRQEQIKTSFTWLNWGRRALRLSNPLGAVFGELRDRVSDRVFDHVGMAVQASLKRLLLQEVVQVSIDLYSGKLQVSDAKLATYQSEAATDDEERAPPPQEPIRLLLLGQVSAGKSSLVNALLAQLQAEADVLPTTAGFTAYGLVDADGVALNLIDSPGIRHGEHSAAIPNLALVQGALEADCLVWVTRATQPARSGLAKLIAEVRAAYAADVARRPPPELLVVTHLDELQSMDDGADVDQASLFESIWAAVGLTSATTTVAVGSNPEQGLQNIDLVVSALRDLRADAQHAQLNRRRTELARQPTGWRKRAGQVRGLGQALGRIARNYQKGDPK